MKVLNAYSTLLLAISTDAFITNHPFTTNIPQCRNASRKIRLHMTSVEDEVAALRAAAQKARDDAKSLERDLGKEVEEEPTPSITNTANAIPVPSLTASEIQSLIAPINFESGDAIAQVEKMNSFAESNKLTLWKAAITSSANTNSPKPIRPYPVTLAYLEQRSSGKITGASLGVDGEDDVSLDDFKDATIAVTLGASVLGVAALAFLPDNVGATLCYFAALVPIIWVAIGSSAPGILAGLIATLSGTSDDKETKEDRICRHEAGHFLCGYLCGLPIRSYSITSDVGFPCVEFHSTSDGEPRRELTDEEVAILSVVAMSGSVAEALNFGIAKGGGNDLLELEGLFRRSKEFLGAKKQQDLTRWGALAAYNLLTANKVKYDKLVSAFKMKKTVSECIVAIESE